MTFRITERPSGSGAICASILAELPEWFGLPASNAEYAHRAETAPAWLAIDNGEVVGLMLLNDHFGETIEIHLIAVRPARHRHGAGRALVEHAEALAARQGARFLTVKTRGPSRPYEPYERTRAFYRALGFCALEEFTELWDADNPALMMGKAVR